MSDDVHTVSPTRFRLLSAPRLGSLTRARRTEIVDLPAKTPHLPSATRRRTRSAGRSLLLSFIALVLAPTALAGFYYGWIASDVYVSESKFAVRGAVEHLPKSAALDMFTPLTAMNSSQDAFVVKSFLASVPLVEKMNREHDLKRMFSRPEIDALARLDSDASAEGLRKYWTKMVTTTIDNLSGVVTLQVKAYAPEEALRLSRALIGESERLVNAISERRNQDSVRFAQDEVARGEARVQAARLALQGFRNENQTVDPVKSAEATMKFGMTLRANRAELEAETAASLRTLAEAAPSIQVLRARLRAVNEQIAINDRQLTGDGPNGRAASAVLYRYEALELERQFAEKLYTLAQTLYERARITADRQSLYLVTFVEPALAEMALFPRRIPGVLLVFVCAAALWSILSLVIAAVRDHQT